jgi:hypothetical protein
MLDLVSSGSSGAAVSMRTVELPVWALRFSSTRGGPSGRLSSSGGSQITEPTPTTVLSSSSSYTSVAAGSTVETLTAAMQTSVASLAAPQSGAPELGNGQTLSVRERSSARSSVPFLAVIQRRAQARPMHCTVSATYRWCLD